MLLCASMGFSQEETFTVKVNLYQPISQQESLLLEEIMISQIKYFIENSAKWEASKIVFSDSPKKIVSKLDELVKDDIRFHKYEDLDDFKGFTQTVKKKMENITSRSYEITASENLSSAEIKEMQLTAQLDELISIIRTELFVYGEKDVYETVTEVYTGLSKEEKEQLIQEIEAFKDGDSLTPIDISYQEITAEDSSGIFIGEPNEKDFADRVLDLLAENSQRLERLESELTQFQISGELNGSSGGGVATRTNDLELLNQLPESLDFYFYTGSSSLSTAVVLQLNEIVEILAQGESIKVVITGFADKKGSPQANLALSKKRAQAVKRFMKDSGMSEDRFIINYYGESKSGANSNQDRRVEIKFFM